VTKPLYSLAFNKPDNILPLNFMSSNSSLPLEILYVELNTRGVSHRVSPYLKNIKIYSEREGQDMKLDFEFDPQTVLSLSLRSEHVSQCSSSQGH
jgi:hypothetical protein